MDQFDKTYQEYNAFIRSMKGIKIENMSVDQIKSVIKFCEYFYVSAINYHIEALSLKDELERERHARH